MGIDECLSLIEEIKEAHDEDAEKLEEVDTMMMEACRKHCTITAARKGKAKAEKKGKISQAEAAITDAQVEEDLDWQLATHGMTKHWVQQIMLFLVDAELAS